VNYLDRDKVRILALLKKRMNEAFNAEELAKFTSIPAGRVRAAGSDLAAKGHLHCEGDYFWVGKKLALEAVARIL
jgi:hypothetical protein